MEEVVMVPQKDFEQLKQWYKGELTKNALLDKASNLAARKHQLLADPSKPAPLVNAHTKGLSRELTKLTKRLRQFPSAGMGAAGGEDEEEEDGNMVTGPVEQWLKRMIKGSPSTPKPQSLQPTRIQGKKSSISKGKSSTPSSSIPKPTTSKGKSSAVQKPATRKYRERLDELRNTLEDLNKKEKRELKSLKPLPEWEDFEKGKKLRRKLDYDDED